MRDGLTLVKNLDQEKDLVAYEEPKYPNDKPIFLLHEDPNDIKESMIIYEYQSHFKVIEYQDVWLSDTIFFSCPKIFNQLWIIHGEVEERVVPLIYCLMIRTKQENYLPALKIIKKEIQKIVLDEQ
ncbi:hypothetical protein DSO57_1019421 [Entomophthora muscae]|uniref:Uncharacterized protein n=1 Tax=Entomophthora muscae TaxID=34485 RepID=A0ACC2RIY6_9FUNG|nr:hypothetical protein DSO57_1019421 [Entomophthora muscae]